MKLTKLIKSGNRVTQAHGLLEGYHRSSPLTLQESRIVLAAMSTVEPQDTVFDSQFIHVKDLLTLFNITPKNHNLIGVACKKLIGKHVEIDEGIEGEDPALFPWFQKIKYYKKQGIVEFQFPNDLKPYLLQLKKQEGFTSYKLEYILQLGSPYSHRIYEISCKWRNAGVREFELEELKQIIGAVKKSYDNYGSFKQKVLNPSLKEINEKTDIDISFEEVKTGRKVTSIIFFIKSKKEKKEKKKTDTPFYKKKITREEPIPKTFEKRKEKIDSGIYSEEEIDQMRRELMEEIKIDTNKKP